jgi:hypothetical protein
MPGLMPGIHVFLSLSQNVDGRDEPGHDANQLFLQLRLVAGHDLGLTFRLA